VPYLRNKDIIPDDRCKSPKAEKAAAKMEGAFFDAALNKETPPRAKRGTGCRVLRTANVSEQSPTAGASA